MSSGGRPKVVVFGGHGFFGRFVVADLLEHAEAAVVVAGRTPRSHWNGRVDTAVCDQHDATAVRSLLHDAAVVVHCAGPYQGLEPTVASVATELGVDYVDMAEDAAFVRAVHELGEQAVQTGAHLMPGMSAVPGLSALLTQLLRARFESIDSVRTFIAPGTRTPRGGATLTSLLSGAGLPLTVPGEHGPRQTRGWSEPEWVDFPPPVGARLTYLALDVADYDLFPRCFGAHTVEFKAGSDLSLINRALQLGARFRHRIGVETLAVWGMRLQRWIGGVLGSNAGGQCVEIGGKGIDGEETLHMIAVVSAAEGHLIPCVLPSLATQALIGGRIGAPGVVPVDSWLEPTSLARELAGRGLVLWHRADTSRGWVEL